jgi:hypothetical protein
MDSLIEKEPFAPPALNVIQEILGSELFQALIFTEKLVQVDDSIVFRDKELIP